MMANFNKLNFMKIIKYLNNLFKVKNRYIKASYRCIGCNAEMSGRQKSLSEECSWCNSGD